jgi:hypothetical protein
MAIEWLVPWCPVEALVEQSGLLKQLQRELPTGHILKGEHVTAIGRREDCDDVLFALEDGRVAVVHLTWSDKTGPDTDFPWTRMFASFDEFSTDEMTPEHKRWE